MKPPLSAPHGTSLCTTAGITAVIAAVVAISVLAQCVHLTGSSAALAECALAALVLGAGGLYTGRNEIGRALDLAAVDARAAGVAAARGLTRFHLGMSGVFTGIGFAAAWRLPGAPTTLAWLAPLAALVLAVGSFTLAISWARETRRRRSAQDGSAPREPGTVAPSPKPQ